MKTFILSIALITCSISASSYGEEWVIKGLKPAGGKKSPAKQVAVQTTEPKLIVVASSTANSLMIELTNGKEKFGKNPISIKRGENTLSHPRFALAVPMEKVKSVEEGAPLTVSEFSHNKKSYEISLVKGDGPLPNLVVTEK